MTDYLISYRLTCAIASILFFATTSAVVFSQDGPFSPKSTDFATWGPKPVDDGLMPAQEEIDRIRSWVDAAFAGKARAENPPFELKLIRQEHNTLKFDESCMGTPLKIGSASFVEGLGTHANSEIRFTFQEPVNRFTAKVGIDNNYNTRGRLGSVRFIVKAGDKELLHTPVRTGRDEPFPIDLALPEGTRILVLEVDTTEDGPSHDQADWCDPTAYGVSGKRYVLSKTNEIPLETKLPFSFTYGGASSDELLPKWTFEEKKIDECLSIYSWTDPESKFKVAATVRVFRRFAAVDWVLDFENLSSENSKLLENVSSTRIRYHLADEKSKAVIHTLSGDFCDENTWVPLRLGIEPGETKTFVPKGGRPSNGVFPFWNIQRRTIDDDSPSGGVFLALGWSGQWKSDFSRNDGNYMDVRAGMETLSTVLLPGESIRTPRMLVMPWKSDRLSAHVLFRRLLLFEYAPKMKDGMPQQMEFIGQCFDRYYRKQPGWEKFDAQVEFARRLQAAGCTAYWFDAAWFPVGLPSNATTPPQPHGK